MKKIYKYSLGFPSYLVASKIEMPSDAVIRHIGLKDGEICLWAEVSPDAPTITRCYYVGGTGHNVLNGTRYLGTVIDDQDSGLVYHVFSVEK